MRRRRATIKLFFNRGKCQTDQLVVLRTSPPPRPAIETTPVYVTVYFAVLDMASATFA